MLAALLGLALAQPPDLTGTWKLTYEVVTKNQVPVIGTLKSSSRSLVLVHIVHRDGALAVTHQVCGSVIDGGIVKSELPAAYLSHIPAKHYILELEERGDALHVKADTGHFYTGFDPGRCSEVPSDAASDCVVDWDEDGHPGATIRAKAPLFPWVEVYVAQRNHLVLEGTVSSADEISGAARLPQMDNRVIGASNKLFARSPKAEIEPDESVFAMSRLAEGATCSDVLGAP